MKNTFIIILFIVMSGLLQHITHEMFHVLVGKLVGLSVINIKWFSYHGGTKVTFKDEDEIINKSDGHIPKEWVVMNLAGIVGTTIMAYLFVFIYLILPIGYIKLLFWILSAMFLIADSGYSVLCSFGNGGDLYLVNKYFNNSIFIKLISIAILIVNLIVFISIR